eukprot:5159739-Pyramimonas_sp.AAC.1
MATSSTATAGHNSNKTINNSTNSSYYNSAGRAHRIASASPWPADASPRWRKLCDACKWRKHRPGQAR